VLPASHYPPAPRVAGPAVVGAPAPAGVLHGPVPTTYAITEDGTLALGERVAEIIATPVNEFPEFPLGLGESHNLPAETVIALLRKRVGHIRADIALYDDAIRAVRAKSLPAKYWVDVRYQRAMAEADAATLEALIHDLESGVLSWDEEKHGATALSQ